VKKTPVSTATASTLKAASGPAAAGAATVAPPRSATPPVVKKPAVASDLFGIAVGTYLNEAHAIAERTSLTESTRLPSRVVTVAEDSVSMYRVVMGSFENRVSAERTASDLIRRGLVNEARVIPLAQAAPPPP
jgi:cell division protein FtsN